jgi:hypothetical protein
MVDGLCRVRGGQIGITAPLQAIHQQLPDKQQLL